jgi:tetratricopeptide (TPR) repeat protein
VFEGLATDDPRDPKNRINEALCRIDLGEVLADLGDPTGAGEQLRRAVAALEGLAKEHPGFDLRLVSWGDGNGVPTSGIDLVIVGTDKNNQLHIRVFDSNGNRVTDTDETRLPPAQAQAISALKQQLPGLLPAHVLTDAERAQVLEATTSIVGQTQHPKRRGFQVFLGEALESDAKVRAKRGRHDEAIEGFRRAIDLQREVLGRWPQSKRCRRSLNLHYINLAGSLRALGRAEEAAEASRERAKLWPRDAAELYGVAGELALCLPIIDREPALRPGVRELRNLLATEAAVTLRLAIAAGWSSADSMAHDPNLAPLRDRDDFRRLLAELYDRIFPTDPFAR